MRAVVPVCLLLLLSAVAVSQERSHAALLARGKYIVEGPSHCFMCHGDVDWSRNGDVRPGTKGQGRVLTPDETQLALPYRAVAPNLTPDRETGAGTWTDEQFKRALRQGIGHDGRTLFVAMPYANFHYLSDEDIEAIIAYLRSLPPIRHSLPKTNLPAQVAATLKPLPPQPPTYKPDVSTPGARGAYLAHVGNCSACHTPQDEQNHPVPELYLSGGRNFVRPFGKVTSANITPDPSGIAYYTRDDFVRVIRTGHVGARALKPLMPWLWIRNLTDSDLSDLYAYLRSVQPVRHRVDNTEEATYCKVCKGKHGYGDRN
jgi:mono/diheme cytochrome c family protein